MTIETECVPFQALSLETLYAILRLRAEVFVVEQESIYQDVDNLDQKAMHILKRNNGRLVGYARILAYDEHAMSFGRIVTASDYRRTGLGKELMDDILSYLNGHYPQMPIAITAQNYLRAFYSQYGFAVEGEVFIMDGLPHVKMVRTP